MIKEVKINTKVVTEDIIKSIDENVHELLSIIINPKDQVLADPKDYAFLIYMNKETYNILNNQYWNQNLCGNLTKFNSIFITNYKNCKFVINNNLKDLSYEIMLCNLKFHNKLKKYINTLDDYSSNITIFVNSKTVHEVSKIHFDYYDNEESIFKCCNLNISKSLPDYEFSTYNANKQSIQTFNTFYNWILKNGSRFRINNYDDFIKTFLTKCFGISILDEKEPTDFDIKYFSDYYDMSDRIIIKNGLKIIQHYMGIQDLERLRLVNDDYKF